MREIRRKRLTSGRNPLSVRPRLLCRPRHRSRSASSSLPSPSSADPNADGAARDRRHDECPLLRLGVDDRRLVHERPHSKSETRAGGAGHDQSVCAFFAVRAHASGHGANGRARAGPDEHGHAEWLATHGDLPHGFPREMLLAGSGLERDRITAPGSEARPGSTVEQMRMRLQAESGPSSRLRRSGAASFACPRLAWFTEPKLARRASEGWWTRTSPVGTDSGIGCAASSRFGPGRAA